MPRKYQIQLFWIAFLATLAILILCSGCTTERKVVKYVEKNPEILDLWTTTDTVMEVRIDTVYRDKLVEVYLPGEHIIDSVPVPIPCPDAKPLNVNPIVVETSFARAEAKIENNQLIIDLEQKDTTLQIRLDSAEMKINRLESQLIEEITRPPPVTKRPWWALPALIIAIFSTCLLILVIFFLVRRKK